MSSIAAWLEDHDGDPEQFVRWRSQGHRLGQAFFNALHERDQRRIQATPVDPFYSDDVREVRLAMEAITEGLT